MKLLNVLLTFGIGSLAATPLAVHHTKSSTFSIESRDIKLHRRTRDKQPSPTSRPTTSGAIDQNHTTRLTASPQPNRNSPSRSSETSPPQGRGRLPSRASSPRTSTQRTSTPERGRSNTSPGTTRSLFPSPPPQNHFGRINPYVAMLGVGKSTIPHSIGRESTGSIPRIQLANARTAKREAREARYFANRRLLEAKTISDTRRANSPETKAVVQDSLEAAQFATEATRRDANQQVMTGVSLIGTPLHHNVDGRFESAARRTARSEQRQSYSIAFEAQHKARKQVEDAFIQPIGREKFNAIHRAASQQKSARQFADSYYRDYEDYRQIKTLIPADSSSSDEEIELSDYPKVWSAYRNTRNQETGG